MRKTRNKGRGWGQGAPSHTSSIYPFILSGILARLEFISKKYY